MVDVTEHVKPPCSLTFSDVNKSCFLIITGLCILREKAVAQEGLFSSAVSPFIRFPYANQSVFKTYQTHF